MADVAIHYDPWWNVAVRNQATDRTYRLGQKNSVTVYKMIVSDTIEEKICGLQQAKKNLAEGIITEEGGEMITMSKEGIIALLGRGFTVMVKF